MKTLLKTFSILLFLTTIFVIHLDSSAQLVAPQLTATASGTTITATLPGVLTENLNKVNIFVTTGVFSPNAPHCPPGTFVPPCTDPQPTKEISGNTIKWTIKNNIFGGTNYSIRAEGTNGYNFFSNVVPIKTGADTIDVVWPFPNSQANATSGYLYGKINNTNISDFTTVILQYSITQLPADKTSPAGASAPIKAQKDDTNNAVEGVNSDGTYVFKLTDLTSNQTYSIRQIIETKSGGLDIKVGSFNSSKGVVAENSASQIKTDQERSYTLLAPLPGLSVVLDNDLCREYLAQGKPVPGGSCDNQISYFINLLIKILIGITAVVLVVKIIIEGYQYMVTDIPFIKASAKTKLFESFFGLLLALSSYLILNTINPKLVSSDLNVAGIDISTEKEEELDGEGQSTVGGKVIRITKSKIKYDKIYTNLVACAGQGGTESSPNAATCIKYSTNISSAASGKYVEKSFAEKLNTLSAALQSKNVTWRITEAWPESRSHKATCHKIGLCIDMNHTSGSGANPNPTVAQVKAVIETAASLGMCAQYEILNNSTLNNQLVAAGLGKNVIFFNGSHISANHYSLYNGTCK